MHIPKRYIMVFYVNQYTLKAGITEQHIGVKSFVVKCHKFELKKQSCKVVKSSFLFSPLKSIGLVVE